MPQRENLGPAERIIQALLTYSDHMVHNRPGLVTPAAQTAVGVRWAPVTHKREGDEDVVYLLTKIGRKSERHRIGVRRPDGTIWDGAVERGRYQPAGLFEEVAVWMYRQVAEVWKLDNEFAAHWASYAFGQEHRDLKVVLAAFMLVQSRFGAPVKGADGKTLFYDNDFREVGEAMMLLRLDKRDLNPKLLLRIHDVLSLPAVAEINRALGFGVSARRPALGRWPEVVTKWLRYREDNPLMLEGLAKAGFRQQVKRLAQLVRYKPETPKFFEILRWKQKQASDGHRTMLDVAVAAAQTWPEDEREICQKIVNDRPSWKVIVGQVPSERLTRAVMAAAIEAGALSDKDLIIASPTLEALGLLEVPFVKDRWQRALKAADDMRAANIAKRMRSEDTAKAMEEAADEVVQKATEEAVRNLRTYFFIDTSGSMQDAIVRAKGHVAKFLRAFPKDQIHVATFTTTGREITFRSTEAKDEATTRAVVEHAFAGIGAGGGTDYGAGIRTLQKYAPKPEEDVLFFFVGDEEAPGFAPFVEQSGLRPVAFAFLCIRGSYMRAVQNTAAQLGIPCFLVDEETFDDPYAIPRTISNLIASTPVGVRPQGAAARKSLIDLILETKLLTKPAWA